MAVTFPEPRGLLIYGARCTGKTTLELNLRQALFNTCKHSLPFTKYRGICFIGRTIRLSSKMPTLQQSILATAGAETLKDLEGIPKVSHYVASVTPGYDKAEVLKFFKKLKYVNIICLYSKNRQRYYEKRCKQYTGYCLSEIGPAKLKEPGFGDMIFPFTMEQLPAAFVAGLLILGIKDSEWEFDYDISLSIF